MSILDKDAFKLSKDRLAKAIADDGRIKQLTKSLADFMAKEEAELDVSYRERCAQSLLASKVLAKILWGKASVLNNVKQWLQVVERAETEFRALRKEYHALRIKERQMTQSHIKRARHVKARYGAIMSKIGQRREEIKNRERQAILRKAAKDFTKLTSARARGYSV